MIRLFRKRAKVTKLPPLQLERRALHSLAALLVLSQLPHVLHLPIWVSAFGLAIVLAKLIEEHKHIQIVSWLLQPAGITVMALAGAVFVRLHYGYFLGRDPCVAFLFILVSAKFAEIRRSADATLLLCLAGFLLLTQYFYSQSILSALITLPAVLALGNALTVVRDATVAPAYKQNLKLTLKLLIQGAPLAALLFIVFPRLPGPLWSLPDDAVATTGLSDSMSPGSIGSLSKSDEVAFRVEFTGSPPPPETRYWRGPVLSQFDGRNWTLNQTPLVVKPSARTHSNAIEYTVTLQPNNQRWLFAIDHPVSLPSSNITVQSGSSPLAFMTDDLQLKSKKPINRVIRYKQMSTISERFRSPTRPSPLQTQLAGKNPETVKFAEALRDTVNSDREFAQAVLRHFNQEPFHYTLEPSLLGDSPVDEFLFRTRNGFCEHYASAFVTLMRAVAIPARVVTGYLGGEMNGDYMIVRQSDAHAWAEVFIDGHWERFDPTGAVAPSRVADNMAAALGAEEPVPLMARSGYSWMKDLKLRIDELNHDWQRMVIDFNNESQSKLWKKLGFPMLELWQLTSLVLMISAIWCVVVLGLPDKQRQKKSAVDLLWQQFLQLLSRHNFKQSIDVRPGKTETPHQYLKRLSTYSELTQNYRDILDIGHEINRLRFERLTEPESADLTKRLQAQVNAWRLRQLLALHWIAPNRNRKQPDVPSGSLSDDAELPANAESRHGYRVFRHG